MEIYLVIFPLVVIFIYICFMERINRLIKKSFISLLDKGKALILIGARQVGKTTFLKNLDLGTDSILSLNADIHQVRERLTNPTLQILENTVADYKIVIIDEVQRIENAGLLMKLLVDNFKDVQFIATGSSALEISDTMFEPLTGRHFLFELYPFSLAELYYDKAPFEVENELDFHLIYGCYPEISTRRDMAEVLLRNLSGQYLYKDVLAWKEIRKPAILDKLLKLLAYQMCSEVSIHELANQLQVKSETVESYIDILEKSYVVFRLPSYNTNKRKEVSKMSKILFWDNGIRNAIINNFNDLSSRNDHGLLFENFMIAERMKMNSYFRPDTEAFFWRNYNKNEVDYVESTGDTLSAFEMKWNAKKNHKISRAFSNNYPNANLNVITPETFHSFVIEK